MISWAMPRAYGRSLRVARTRDADALWMCHSLGLHTGVFVFCGKGGEDGRCLCLFWTEVITLVDGCWELFTRSRDYKIYQRTNKELQSHSAAAGDKCPASNEGTLVLGQDIFCYILHNLDATRNMQYGAQFMKELE